MNAVTEVETTALAVHSSSAGALLMDAHSMERLERIADLMASGKTTVPQHLRGSKGDCFAITLQSMQWGMNPFSVAQKTHLVNGVLGYEAQLVAAVINSSGVVKDRFHFEWYGPWEKIIGKFKQVESRTKKDDDGNAKKLIVPDWKPEDEQGLGVKIWATLRGEATPREMSLLLTQARTRNSTLWTEDPKQQLAYLAQKRWSRLYAPDVILGVYSPDELSESGEKHMGMADVVAPPAPPAPPTEWPDDLFAERLPEWHKAIATKRATADNIIAKAQTKYPLTDAQKEAIRKGAATDAGPVVTFAEVADKLAKASTLDALNEAGDLIGAVADPDHRKELAAKYDQRATELNPTE